MVRLVTRDRERSVKVVQLFTSYHETKLRFLSHLISSLGRLKKEELDLRLGSTKAGHKITRYFTKLHDKRSYNVCDYVREFVVYRLSPVSSAAVNSRSYKRKDDREVETVTIR